MSKICPMTNDVVLYLDCLECEEKVCKKENFNENKAVQKQYNRRSDAFLSGKGVAGRKDKC